MVRPYLKWAGGKRQLVDEIRNRLPSRFNTYFEPFVGGGAVFFKLQRKKAVINDLNEELILTYKAIRDNCKQLIEELETHKQNNCKEYYYNLREWDRNDSFFELDEVKRAARLIYLNKTCYNGLYRVNSQGKFNTPYGRYDNPSIYD